MPEPFDPKKFDEKFARETIEWTTDLRRDARYRTTGAAIVGVMFGILAFILLTLGKLLAALFVAALSAYFFWSAKGHSENL
jgi:hypothetical protein